MLDLRDKGFMIRRDMADARATGKSSVICTPYGQQYHIGWSKPPAQMRQEFRTIGVHGSKLPSSSSPYSGGRGLAATQPLTPAA